MRRSGTATGLFVLTAMVVFAACDAPLGEGFFTAELAGVVRTAAGAPVVGARVEAFGPDTCEAPEWTLPADTATTDAAGGYAVRLHTFGSGAACIDGCAHLLVVPGPGHAFETTVVEGVSIQLCPAAVGETALDIVVGTQ